MRSNYRRIGDYIALVDERNVNLEVTKLLGLSISKQFIPSVANTIGANMKNYKIIRKDQFACSVMQVRRDGKMPVALLRDFEEAIISQAYPVFEVIDTSLLLPEYLMMWFTRSEFDRQATFHAVGGVRGSLEWEDFMDFELPVPSLEAQQEIVNEYHTITKRIELNEQLNQKLEETAQALYKHWFVDFEFPCLPPDYRPHGQVNLKISDDDLRSKIAQVCTYKRMGGLPISDGRIWCVYLILCDDDSIYKGITNDLYRRFYEHYTGLGAKHTQKHKPIKVIHWESFDTKEEAAKREKDLKTGYGRTWISRQIEKAGGLHQIKTGLPAPTTQLRTAGKMVYNEELDGEIPEGWENAKLENLLTVKYGKDYKHLKAGEIPLYGSGGVMGYYNQALYDKPSILIPRKGSLDNVLLINEPFWSVDTMFFTKITDLRYTNYLFQYLKGIDYYSLNVGSAVPSMTTKVLNDLTVLSPLIEVLESFENAVYRMRRVIKDNLSHNKNLVKLQNLLLSKMATVGSEEVLNTN